MLHVYREANACVDALAKRGTHQQHFLSVYSSCPNFAAATVARLMTYALGRQLEKSDEAAVREITTAAKPGGYRFEDLVTGVVTSAPFQERQTKESP